uniref:Mitochondrial import receptor subunit TOM6 homolog n=1 Tax=Tanacetum cinerariifolium TaxID=118510 RepID=A0A6L2NSY3_TANCI|nr:mitochondrial import receptor subunit TOM6 homolog [Tanacetum cinerariifolium]
MVKSEHLVTGEIEQIMEGGDNVDEDEFVDEIFNNQEDPSTKLEPEGHKERSKEEKIANLMIIDVDEEESAGDEKLKEFIASDPTPLSSQPITSSSKPKSYHVKYYKSVFHKMSRRYGYMFRHLKQSFMPRKDFGTINKGVHATLKEVVSKMVDHNTNDFMKNNLPNKIKFEIPTPLVAPCRLDVIHTRDDEDHHDNDARESSSSRAMDESTPSGSGTQEELEDFDAWLNEKCINDDEIPTEEVTLEISAEVSEKEMTSDDIQRMQNTVNIMMRDRCNSDHIRRQQKKRDNLDEAHSDVKIVEVVNVQFDQGYGPEYMIMIAIKRTNGKYSEFAESDYKYLQKNDNEDMNLMCINGIIKDYRQTGLKIQSYCTDPHISRKKEKLVIITSEPVVGLIYENNKKDKRVMVIKEIPKFYDATLKRVLEKVKKFNLDVKHGYANPDLNNEDAEYIEFYEEYIKERLRKKNQTQIREKKMFPGMFMRKPDKAVALKQLRVHLGLFGAWVAAIRVAPYVLHYFSDTKDELVLDF